MSGFTALLVVVYIFAGASNGLNCKSQFQTCVPSIPSSALHAESVENDCPPGQRHFNKPWMQNLMMFCGEFSLLLIYITTRAVTQAWNSRRGRSAKSDSDHSSYRPSVFAFLLPAFCDFLGTGLQAVGLMYVSAPVAQMMQSSMVIFSAGLTVAFLKKKLLGFHYVALVITVLGLISVSYAALGEAQSAQGNLHDTVVGLSIILVGILCNAFQTVFEEYLLSGYSVSAQWATGLEGMWGILIQGFFLMVFMKLPGDDNGVLEDFQDSVIMYSSEESRGLRYLTLLYLLSIASSQLCGMTITKRLSAVTNCMLANVQTVLVWLVTLSLYYCGHEQYGSPWTSYSWFQLLGFMLVIAGTMIYNEMLVVPFLTYEQAADENPGTALWARQITDVSDRFGRQVSDIHLWSPGDLLGPVPGEEEERTARSSVSFAKDVQFIEQPLMNNKARQISCLSKAEIKALTEETSALFLFSGAKFLRQLSEPPPPTSEILRQRTAP